MAETAPQYIDRILEFVGDRDPLETLRATAPGIGELIAGRPDADLHWSTSPDRWSAAAIVTHLADAEVVASYRLRMILATSGTPIQAFDQNAWAAAFKYGDQDAFASLALFRALRHAWLALLAGMDPACLDRYGLHQERGKETVRHLLRLYAGHDLNHLQQLVRILDERDRVRGTPVARFDRRPIKPEIGGERKPPPDIRVGTIRRVEPVPRADRLMLMTVDFGDRERTVVAGIRQERRFPEALVGRQALFVVNLAPRTIHGHLSEAMLFDIGFEDGLRPALAEPEWPVPNGTRVG